MSREKIRYNVIPEDILLDYLNRPLPSCNMCCDCGYFNENIRPLPYAWDSETNEVIWMYKCKNCGSAMYTHD